MQLNDVVTVVAGDKEMPSQGRIGKVEISFANKQPSLRGGRLFLFGSRLIDVIKLLYNQSAHGLHEQGADSEDHPNRTVFRRVRK